MDKFSDLIERNTELWWEWNKLFAKTNDASLSWEERAECCTRCEATNEEINKVIEKMDLFFDHEVE